MIVWELLRNTFADIGVLAFGKETAGGSQVLLTDTTQDLTIDEEIAGVAVIISGSNQGDVVQITDNDATTLTVESMTVNITIGDRFIWQNEFREAELLLMVNRALDIIGRIPSVPDTSITTVAAQTEYTLPVAVKRGQIRGIYYQGEPDDANDNRWIPIRQNDEEASLAGTAGVLILKPQLPAGRTVRIEYMGLHPEVTAYDDNLSDKIHPSLAKAALKVAIGNTRAEGAINSARGYNLGSNKAEDELAAARTEHPIMPPEKKSKIMTFPRQISRRRW